MSDTVKRKNTMSAIYSLLVIFLVAVVLTINSLWFHKSNDHLCADCDNTQQRLEVESK